MSELEPLSQRIQAPTDLPVVVHAALAEVRPATIDDLEALVTLTHAAEAVDHPSWASPREEVEDLLEGPMIDAAVDTLIGFDAAGRALAFASIMPASSADTRVQVYTNGIVHPEVRTQGIGTMLLTWTKARALQHLATREETLPAWIAMYAQERTVDAIAVGLDAGFTVERYFHTMERDLAADIPDIAIADEFEIVTLTPELREPTRLARNNSFRDHWGSQPTSPEKWERFVTGEIFRPDLSVVAVERGTTNVVGFTLSSVNEDDTELQGYRASYIDLIGVVRERRGHKLAPALIAEALRRARADGLAKATLDVDSSSPTGANTLYEGMGFTATDVEVALVIEL
ncbi:GNAT family N-acetyltransferase [Microbacterium sp. NC79]|uniref:GNAT family N-acetyltransferase n=1 Tax=Microbacterium sp. NC79 TaxID=2851009 RepID=UPI001C2C4703|nr:GNAT family N-acetyltransferase [Microbacterium sp. NC79]MBV0894115.1 GNAT family N-acetyltransferase [Microbacterium sp. NC79]